MQKFLLLFTFLFTIFSNVAETHAARKLLRKHRQQNPFSNVLTYIGQQVDLVDKPPDPKAKILDKDMQLDAIAINSFFKDNCADEMKFLMKDVSFGVVYGKNQIKARAKFVSEMNHPNRKRDLVDFLVEQCGTQVTEATGKLGVHERYTQGYADNKEQQIAFNDIVQNGKKSVYWDKVDAPSATKVIELGEVDMISVYKAYNKKHASWWDK